MEPIPQISQYLELLSIRRAALNRDSVIAGIAFVVFITATLTAGLLLDLSGRMIYLIAALDTFFGIIYLVAWVRLEIVKESIALLQTIQRAGG